MAITLTSAAADAMSTALNTYINSGGAAKLRIYGGSVPANPSASPSATVLATFDLNTPNPFTSSGGVLTLAGVPKTVSASAGGTANHFRILLNNGTTTVLQGSVGTSGADLILNTVTITSGVNVTITSGQINVPTA